MVNFRFHLVSLTAVFLALAVGIGLGATVVDRATVEALERRLDGVARRVDRTDRENQRLERELGRWSRFSEEAGVDAVRGRLEGLPVLVVGVQGTERQPVEELQASLIAAGARLGGTVWLTSKMRLDKPEDVAALATVLNSTPRSPDALRRAAVTRVAASLSGTESAAVLAVLQGGAFMTFESPGGSGAILAAAASSTTRLVVVSGAGAEVPNDQLALPLTSELVRTGGARVLAAEPGREPEGREHPGVRAAFVGPLREDRTVAGQLSTVDNLEDFKGRFAAIYALRDLTKGKVGHFGVGPRATRLVPETAS